MRPYEGGQGERLEMFRSTDRGATWKFHSYLQAYPDHRHSRWASISMTHTAWA